MNISDVIDKLEELKRMHGDIEVTDLQDCDICFTVFEDEGESPPVLVID